MTVLTLTKTNVEHSNLIEQIDLLFIAIEALDINGVEAIVWASRTLDLTDIIPNRVRLWRLRCCNPMRYRNQHKKLSLEESDALIQVLSLVAKRLYPTLHQLLSTTEPAEINFQRWTFFHIRFIELIKKTMNLHRHKVRYLLQDTAMSKNERRILTILGLAAGEGGIQRLRAILLATAG
ncbi:MAG TPA: DUF3038 domain-containing protein [Prochlorococcaceae cyanobacterium AMR_MDS_5431]|nr:DUF3038 domain-containing protein [Prochlorococcaceae cyanobacterium AMR_MDS_5431]